MANQAAVARWLLAVALGAGMVAAPQRVLAQRPLGIDVSSYQGSGVNWTSVKGSGIVFAWAKATEGVSVIDADFTINENNGKPAGVYMGAYHFAHPEDNTPGSEAGYFWGEAGQYILADGKTLMPMLDMETFTGIVGASTYSQWVNDWSVEITSDAANAGVTVKPFIYVSACKAANFDSSVAQWFSDIANYGSVDGGNNPQTGTPWSSCSGDDVWGSGVWHVWQYESVGSTPGVSGNCDEDVYNGTLAQLTSSSIATVSGNGAIYYWDPQGTNGTNPYLGSMSGNWENSDWTGSAGGQTTPIAWVEGKASCFGVHTGINTPAYTVTMNSNHTVAGFFDGALTPNACDITIAGAGTIILAGGPQALDAHNASDGSSAFLRINCAIGGIGQMFPEGNGQSFLNGTNFFSGGFKFGYFDITNGPNPFSGVVNFNNGSSFGTGTITFWQYGSGGALVLEGTVTSAVTITNPVTVASATTNNIVGNPAGLAFSGPWTLSASFNIGSGGASGNLITISGPISGSGGLTKFNPGMLALSGANSYTGANVFQLGTVFIGADNNLGAVPGSVTNASINLSNVTLSATSSFTLNAKRGITLKASSTISVASGQNLTYGGIIAGSTFGVTKSGTGTLTLSGANTYSGATAVTQGTLALAGGSIGASAVTVSSGATLANTSTGTRTIGGATTLNSGALATFTATGPGTIGKISATGNLTLNNNAITVNVSGSSLAAGTYRLMDCTGTLSGSANSTPTLTGTALSAGLSASVATTAGASGHFDLVISKSTPAFTGLTTGATATYGATAITLGGTVSASGPVYPAMGETVTATIDGNAQNTTTSDATGDFSINYALAGIPASGTPYTITYSYGGDGGFNAASNASTTLTLNPLPAVLTGTRPFDGTNDAPASILSVANKVGSDAVTVASGSGTVAGSSVGSQAITSFGTLALGGAAAGNYTLVGASGTVTITSTTFAITSSSVDSTGTNFIITFQSTPGTSYRVIGSTDLSAALSTWTNVSGPIVASGTSTSVTNPIISSLNFFSVASP